jgi:hypothetical protein
MPGDREIRGQLDALGDRLEIGSSAVCGGLVRLRALEADMQPGSPLRTIARVGAEPQMCRTQAERLGHLSTGSSGDSLSQILPTPRPSMRSKHRMSFRSTSQ